jgi:glycosyltransferase involved in cell wall biosynthesis
LTANLQSGKLDAMRVLWICGLPKAVEQMALRGEDHGSQATWSWIVAHLPPPSDIELHVGCLWPGGDRRKSFEFQGATFHLLPCPARGRALLLFQADTHYFRLLFNELKPDLVHGWGTEDSYGLVARRLAPKRHVISIQGLIRNCYQHLPKTYRNFLIRITEQLTLKKARNVIAESHYSLENAAPLCPFATKRVIEHPVRQEFLVSSPSAGLAQTVLFVGTLQESKGIKDALIAFSRVAPSGWSLHVVGSGIPENEDRMNEFVRDAGISARFHHCRTLSAHGLAQLMQRSSVFLLPTRVDSGPTALKEALTMGLWPVCYDNSGPHEYVQKYAFGSLAKNQDIFSLFSELERCLTEMPWKDANKRIALAHRTREDFSREKAWEQLLEFYQTVAHS